MLFCSIVHNCSLLFCFTGTIIFFRNCLSASFCTVCRRLLLVIQQNPLHRYQLLSGDSDLFLCTFNIADNKVSNSLLLTLFFCYINFVGCLHLAGVFLEVIMIQDIAPHTYHNEYRPHNPGADDIVLFYGDQEVYAKPDGSFYRAAETDCRDLTYLFRIDDTSFYLSHRIPSDAAGMTIRRMRTYEPAWLSYAAVTGWQLWRWYDEHRYCGRCGSEMKPDEAERAMKCPQCGKMVYPTIMPAVIVGVLNEKDQLLVTKYAGRNQANYALVAGFAEIGETIEETVIREVKEETGLDVKNPEFFHSQPWSFSDTLLFGFWVYADSSQPVTLDDHELGLARWISRGEIDEPDDSVSLTALMIRTYLKGLKHGS